MSFPKSIKLVFILSLFFSSLLFAKPLTKITLQLSWFDQFQFAGYYMAKEKGFYKEAGFDVEIKPFKFGIDIPKEVSDGKFDFAVGRETLILERTKNRKIVALYALFQTSPLILISTEKSGINDISDFNNKKIMTTIDDASEVSLKAMINSHKVKLEDLFFLKHTHDINDLINGNTDVISAYLSKSPYELQQRNIAYNIFNPKEFGFDMYSDFLYTSENLIKNNLNKVMAFKNASLKGWEYAYSNIEESVDVILDKYNAQFLKKDELLFEAKELKKLSYFGTNKLGEIRKDKTQRIYDLYNVMGLIPTPIDTDKFVLDLGKQKDKFSNLNFSILEKDYIKNRKKINMCILPGIKPYSYFENNEFKGFVADYFHLIEERTNLLFSLVKTDDLTQSLTFLKEKKCDILTSLEALEKRKKYAKFTSPYLDIPMVLISNNKTPFVDDFEVLKNKKIGLTKSYSANKKIRDTYPNIKFVDVKDLDEGLRKVSNGELYGHIDLLHTSWYKLYEKDLTKLKIAGKLDIEIPVSIGIRDDDYILYSILEKVVNSISTYQRDDLLKKWVTVEYKKEFDYVLLWQILFVVTLLLLAILYKQKILKQHNESLKEKVDIKTRELLEINSKLEEKIKKEVAENLKKDRLLSQQSKLIAMGQMIENIAHQWRQPLSLITTGASGIKIKKQMNDLDDKFLDSTLNSIIDTSKYLSNTIDDFRQFYKPQKEKEIFDLNKCCKKTLELINPTFLHRDIEIICNSENLSINNYESELIQVMINILNNSKDALALNKLLDQKLIFIDIYKEDNDIVIRIKDNAGGIDEKILDKIYEPYFTTKHQSQGTGIGLFMCQEILSKHMNGSIKCQNVSYEYNQIDYKGASFEIRLFIV